MAERSDLFKGSILYDYSTRIDSNSHDPQWHVLNNIVSLKVSALKLTLPANDELVIHLRLGNTNGFNLAPEILVHYIDYIIRHEDVVISTVTIVTAIHFGKNYIEKHRGNNRLETEINRFIDTLDHILCLFKTKNIKAALYSHADIDRDFCFLSNATLLVLGNGNFSLCALILSGGTIFIPPWTEEVTKRDLDTLRHSKQLESLI